MSASGFPEALGDEIFDYRRCVLPSANGDRGRMSYERSDDEAVIGERHSFLPLRGSYSRPHSNGRTVSRQQAQCASCVLNDIVLSEAIGTRVETARQSADRMPTRDYNIMMVETTI